MLSVAECLGRDGPFATSLRGFAPRIQQQEMAETVAGALDSYRVLVCEAGTGTGKTFAYLVPAILSGRRVIVSTGTKSLQEQLFHRDLPLVTKSLGVPVKTALLKGRANYLCPQRTGGYLDPSPEIPSNLLPDLARIRSWAGTTRTGDISELSSMAENSPIWRYATSTVDNCLGQECPALPDCFVWKARRAAMEADILVVNHHLFFADMALRDGGFGELLPGADGIILDEAHQIAEVASQFFGTSLSSRQLTELAKDSLHAYYKEAGDLPDFTAIVDAVEKSVRDLRLSFGTQTRRAAWREIRHNPNVVAALEQLRESLAVLEKVLSGLAERGKELQNCHRRGQEIGERFGQVTGDDPETNNLQWFETHTRTFILHNTPLEIAETFGNRILSRKCAWVFTSATLAVNGSFSHITGRLGLHENDEGLWESPFDFARQTLSYFPPQLPLPSAPDFTRKVVEKAVPVLEASRGRAFILFTSYRALREAAELLADLIEFPLLVQGEAPRNQLLESFRTTPNAVLLGTSSFWEGVDVRGEALSCVIIDKLPFAAPNDPVLQSRYALIREQGGNPFMDYQLPQAVIALKQGVGRLIRDVSDRGVLVLCDPRLHSRPYGRMFLHSLPPMPRTGDIEDVRQFFNQTD